MGCIWGPGRDVRVIGWVLAGVYVDEGEVGGEEELGPGRAVCAGSIGFWQECMCKGCSVLAGAYVGGGSRVLAGLYAQWPSIRSWQRHICARQVLEGQYKPFFRYVKTTANATVDHLSKYLALRIALEETPTPGPDAAGLEDVSEKQYTIYITTAGGAFTVRGGGGETHPIGTPSHRDPPCREPRVPPMWRCLPFPR